MGAQIYTFPAAHAQNKAPADLETLKRLAAQAKIEKSKDKFLAYENAILAIYRSKYQADKTKEAEVYCDLANFYFENKNYAPAAQNFQLCLNIIRPLCSENSVTVVVMQSNLEKCFTALGDKTKADALNVLSGQMCGKLMDTIQRRIKSAWRPDKSNSSFKAVGQFKVNGNGDYSDIRLSKSSSSTLFDEACLAAMKNTNAKPMQSWQYYQEPVNVEFNFDYNVHNGVSTSTSGIQLAPPALAVLNGTNKINSEINRLLTEFIASDIDKSNLNLKGALLVVALCERYMNLGQVDKADALIKELLLRPRLSQSESVSKTILQAEMGCIMLKRQKPAIASTEFEQAVNSPLFAEPIPLTERQRFLKGFGDALFMQDKEAEANAVYARLAALTK